MEGLTDLLSGVMKIGVQLPEVERPVGWAEARDIARTVEDCGFDSIWVGDHLLYRDESGETRGPWEAWTSLAALAEATSRVELAPLVAATSFHNPAMIAKFASTVDEVSGGRLILGLGAGWNRTEYEAFGFPYDHRVSRFEEAFTIIRTLVRKGSIDFEGQYYTHRGMELLPLAHRTPNTPDYPHPRRPHTAYKGVVNRVSNPSRPRGIGWKLRDPNYRLPIFRPITLTWNACVGILERLTCPGRRRVGSL